MAKYRTAYVQSPNGGRYRVISGNKARKEREQRVLFHMERVQRELAEQRKRRGKA